MTMSQQRVLPQINQGVRSALISDSLDAEGVRENVMNRDIIPVNLESSVYGFAKTIKFMAGEEYDASDPYGKAIDFLDSLEADDVVIIATDNSTSSAFWGELFSAAAKGRGARGVICDGPVRDTAQISMLNFPVFANGTLPLDYKGRMKVVATHEPVNCGGVSVSSGDLVIADRDGVAVIPNEKIDSVLLRANARAATEGNVLKDLLSGRSVREVWDQYRVL